MSTSWGAATCLAAVVAIVCLCPIPDAHAAPPHAKPVREIFIPFEDLDVVLEGTTRRVFLTRDEYKKLKARAEKRPDDIAPLAAAILSAQYDGQFEQGRAQLHGTVQIEILRDGLHRIPLTLSGLGIRRATLDDKPAPLGRDPNGGISVLVEGRGRHRLELHMVFPLQTTAAQQSFRFQVPTPPSTRIELTVPGNIEVKSGAAIARRTLTEDGTATQFDLVPTRGPMAIVMSLNNRLRRARSVVIARSVMVSEITQAYERLHVRIAMDVVHGAVDQFRFALPDGFEVTHVTAAQLSQWVVEESKDGGHRTLIAHLREPTSETVALNIAAERTPASLEAWSLPKLRPLDVAGQVAVLGVVVEDRLNAETLSPEGLIAIDNAVLTNNVPESVFQAEPGAPRIRPVATYYASQPDYALTGRFELPPAQMRVTTHLLLTLGEGQQEIRGGFAVLPEADKLFALKIAVPADWHVTQVTREDGKPLPIERYDVPTEGEAAEGEAEQAAAKKGAILHVRLPIGLEPGRRANLYFNAVATPAGWLDAWKKKQVTFPRFAVQDAVADTGTIAVWVQDDFVARPDQLDGLIPLDQEEVARAGLAGVPSSMAYGYDKQPYGLTLAVERTEPWITAQTYSFLKVEPDSLKAHYEVNFKIEQAATRRLLIELPGDTPESIAIRGLDGVKLKEFTSEVRDEMRRWTVLLAERRRGRVRLAIDFGQRMPDQEPKDYALPLIRAAGVAFQSGHVAVEGSPDLDVQIKTSARPVDVGEVSDADYLPGRRLLGAYAYGGGKTRIAIDVFRHPAYRLPGAIVQRVEMVTALSASGVSQTVARYDLRTKSSFLEVALPEGSRLWSVLLDGQPSKPQRDGDRVLLSLPPMSDAALRKLQIVYETPTSPVGVVGSVDLTAPRLFLRTDRNAARDEVPVADVRWYLRLPNGYRVANSRGTVFTHKIAKRPSPLAAVAATFYTVAGGVNPYSVHLASREKSASVYHAMDDIQYEPNGTVDFPMTANAPADHIESPESALAEAEVEANFKQKAQENSVRESKLSEGYLTSLENVDRSSIPFDDAVPAIMASEEDGEALTKKRKKFSSRDLATGLWALEGLGSLSINVEQTDDDVLFESLGADPRLQATLVQSDRLASLAWAAALAVLLVGVVLTRRPVRTKMRYVVGVALVSGLLPLVTGWINELGDTFDAIFYAACLLVPYYLVAGAVGWLFCQLRGTRRDRGAAATGPSTTTMATWVAIGCLLLSDQTANAQRKPVRQPPIVVQVTPPPAPIDVPDDAIVVPYDLDSRAGLAASVRNARKLLIPYDQYLALWNRAYPDKKLQAEVLPADFALSGATYQATLEGDEFLDVKGHMQIELFRDGDVTIPLPLSGGVLARALLDGKPARMQMAMPRATGNQPPNAQQAAPQKKSAPARGGAVLLLHASGKGSHRLELTVRFELKRHGGWRAVAGNLPAAPATGLTLVVPQAKTEVRLGAIHDRPDYETTEAQETIETALSPGGALQVQWRPRVAEGQLDQSLTATSEAVLDVREDGLQLTWKLIADFGRSERDAITVTVPSHFLIGQVEGDNVRGWTAKPDGARQQVDITLLKAARGRQVVTLRLANYGRVGHAPLAQFPAPWVGVRGAILHRGRYTIRRSPVLDLQTRKHDGVTRVDLGAADVQQRAPGDASAESPLGLRAYEAYRFVAAPFTIDLAASEIEPEVSAVVQTLVKVAEREATVESLLRFHVKGRSIHRVRVALPKGMALNSNVQAPGVFQWSQTEVEDRRIVTLYLAEGQMGDFPVVLTGRLDTGAAAGTFAMPKIEVLDVTRQQGDIVVQIDPAYDVRATDLVGCEKMLLRQTHTWLVDPAQRALARLALRYRSGDYSATLRFTARRPRVTNRTITNVRVTERAVEETILLNFVIHEAGIRSVTFLLPEAMRDARISAPHLRQKTITPADDPSRLRVRLDLQDDVMGQLSVKVVSDRLLTAAPQSAPIPIVETGTTQRRYVLLENAGRDELVVQKSEGLESLDRQQKQWRELAELLGGSPTQAYLVGESVARPELTFAMKERKAVETAGATIGLAKTTLVVDGAGAYRGVQEFRLDNQTEQFLEIVLPAGATLWTARVAGLPVKPIEVPGSKTPGTVQIPLIKTAPGDLDFAVALKYGGRLAGIRSLRSVGFPLIRTVNIHVALSQVRLHLPEDHRWFDFGGTMRLVDEEDLVAGQVAYNTQQILSCFNALSSLDEYSQARATANLRILRGEQQALQQGAIRSTELLNDVYDKNNDALEEAERQVMANAQKASEGQDAFGNRGRIDKVWSDQRNQRARNIVNQAGQNFKFKEEVTKGSGKVKSQQKFDENWFNKNALDNPNAQKQLEGNRYGDGGRRGKNAPPSAAKPGKDGGFEYDPATSDPSVVGGQALQRAITSGYNRTNSSLGANEPEENASGEDTIQQRASRYQSKLVQQQQSQFDQTVNAPQGGARRESTATTYRDPSGHFQMELGVNSDSGLATLDGRPVDFAFEYAGRQSAGVPATVAPPTGLASLDVELPVRGREFRFTTPRGDVQVSARSISSSLLARLESLGWIVGAALLIVVATRWIRRGGLAMFAGVTGSVTLIVLGVASLLTCVFPVLGVIVIVVGIVLFLRCRVCVKHLPG